MMQFKSFLIVSLLAVFMAAPIVDAIACEDCRDIVQPRIEQQLLSNENGQSAGGLASSDPGHPAPQGTGTKLDLCPVCANMAAATGNTCCGALSVISISNHTPTMIAFSDPSYSIIKPPQN
jgi:hypothetical protein